MGGFRRDLHMLSRSLRVYGSGFDRDSEGLEHRSGSSGVCLGRMESGPRALKP